MKLLVIGVGYWGSKLLDKFCHLLGPGNVYASDLDIKAGAFGDRLLAGFDADYRNLLPRVDAVVIATPPATHYEIASACLLAGKHALVEKPMARAPWQARELIEVAQRKRLTLMTDDTFLYSPWVLAALNTHGRPKTLFDAMEARWTGPRRPGAGVAPDGVWWTLAPHPVSLMLKFMGRYPVSIEGSMSHTRGLVRYRFVGGGDATIWLDWDTPGRQRYLWWAQAGSESSSIDFDVQSWGQATQEPLWVMCAAFCERTQRPEPWIDLHGYMVVEVLAKTEMEISKLREATIARSTP